MTAAFPVYPKSWLSSVEFPQRTWLIPSTEVCAWRFSGDSGSVSHTPGGSLQKCDKSINFFLFFTPPLHLLWHFVFPAFCNILGASLTLSTSSLFTHSVHPAAFLSSSPDWAGVELRLNSKETGQTVASTEIKFYNCSTHKTWVSCSLSLLRPLAEEIKVLHFNDGVTLRAPLRISLLACLSDFNLSVGSNFSQHDVSAAACRSRLCLNWWFVSSGVQTLSDHWRRLWLFPFLYSLRKRHKVDIRTSNLLIRGALFASSGGLCLRSLN